MKKVSLTRSELKKHSSEIFELLSKRSLANFKGGTSLQPPKYDNVAYPDTTYVRK
ncbi:MAG: hypothetical protein Q8907_00145 [Bacteroidota bacterium]|nr:hypothetical protein [Bacteroidota bacterium]